MEDQTTNYSRSFTASIALILTGVVLIGAGFLVRHKMRVGEEPAGAQTFAKPCADATGVSLLDCGSQAGTGNFDFEVPLTPTGLSLWYNTLGKWRLSVDDEFVTTGSKIGLQKANGTFIPFVLAPYKVGTPTNWGVADVRWGNYIASQSSDGSTITLVDGNGTKSVFVKRMYGATDLGFKLTSVSDRNGRATIIGVDSNSRIASISFNDSPMLINGFVYALDDPSIPTQFNYTSANGATATITFKKRMKSGKPCIDEVTFADQSKWSFQYSGTLVTLATDPYGNRMGMAYTGNYYISNVTQRGVTTYFTYMANSVTTKDSRTEMIETFDSYGRLTAVEINKAKTFFGRNTNGQIDKITDPYNRITNFTYFSSTESLVKTINDGTVSQVFNYVKYVPPVASVGMFYFLSDQTVSGGGNSTNTVYTWNRNSDGIMDITSISINGNSIDLARDYTGNITSVVKFGESVFTGAVYGSLGVLTSYRNILGEQFNFTYDAWGRVTSAKDPSGIVNEITSYNTFGQPVILTSSDDTKTTLTYSAAGRVDSVKYEDPSSSAPVLRTDFTRDAPRADGSLTKLTVTDFVNGAVQGSTTTYFDKHSEVARVEALVPAGTVTTMDASTGSKAPLYQPSPFPQ